MGREVIIKDNIKKSLKKYFSADYKNALKEINKVISSAVKKSDKVLLSKGMALKCLYLYHINEEPFVKIMSELENAAFLANLTDDIIAKDTVNFVFAYILYGEKDINASIKYFNLIKDKENPYFNYDELKANIIAIQKDSENSSDPMIALLNIAKTISSKTNIDSLLKTIADETTYALNAERCSVFLLDKEKKELWSKVATGIDFEEIRFPMDKGLAGHVAMSGETVNIKDAYSDSRFNKEIDMQTGYHTRNILCMPMRNMHYEIIGALQVLNKLGGSFSEYDEKLLVTIGMNAGIAIENSRLFEKQQQMLEQQKQLFSSFVDTLVASIDARDKITSGHSNRVKLYSRLLCEEMNIDPKMTDLIEQAAILHDIGKIGIKDSVLQKEGKLTDEEYAHIKEHVKITHDILSKIYKTKDTKQIAIIASSHHEKFNGSGYFQGLKGEQIPIGGRILAVADVFDTITSKRHYRDKMPIKEVISTIIKNSGSHFDPKVANGFLNITCDKIIEVFLSENNQHISKKDKKILSGFKLGELYDILKKGDKYTDSGEELIKIFLKYYKS